ncbi:hypothetical protein BDY17DRAFT_199852 [Neohortaea acidophila]|uniref:RRM domain-containing protein n=1 Tax=Neohortaea acidophila TaxID=245834 RepID=A0A6A6PLE4_9PEZI|nr:uncharacterized protein BDY17DRAFT_199852 [Neohortaea acidophila]KAF2480755.1 hypothetical protein BDY17DRAFT_199852 [Neohortaea acidophila]
MADEVNYLRYRNIVLETELRMVKDQLAQAQSGTQYLLHCLSTQSQYVTHDHNLASTLAAIPTFSGIERHSAGQPQNLSSAQASFDPGSSLFPHFRPHPRNQDRDESEQDLLTFNDRGASSAEARAAGELTSASGSNSTLIDSEVVTPLTAFDLDNEDQLIALEVHSGNSYLTEDTVGKSGCFPTDLRPAASANYGETPLENSRANTAEQQHSDHCNVGGWVACQPPKPSEPVLIFDRPFAHHEHNRLMGAAVFIESMTGEERATHWRVLEKDSNRHTAADWKQYYDYVVRPAFLAKYGPQDSGEEGQTKDKMIEREPDKEHELERILDTYGTGGLKASRWAFTARQSESDMSRADEGANQRPNSPSAGGVGDDTHPLGLMVQRIDSPTITPGSQSDTTQSGEMMEASHANSVKSSAPMSTQQTSTVVEPVHVHGSRGIVGEGLPEFTFDPFKQRPGPRPSNPTICRSFGNASHVLYKFNCKDENLFRTMLISNIPANITLTDILSAVRGGKIVSTRFFETVGMRTNPPIQTNAATIEFLGSNAAKACVDFVKANPIRFWSTTEDAPVQAKVEMLRMAPTRPLDPQLLADFREGLTRVLFIIDTDARWTAEQIVSEFVRGEVTRPLKAGRDEDGILFFEFGDAKSAGEAWRVVDRCYWFFGGAQKGFFPDPCAGSLEEVRGVGVVGKTEDGVLGKDEGQA